MAKPIYSHHGKLLRDHLMQVLELGLEEYRRKTLALANQHELEMLVKVVLVTHDFGKATTYFQAKLDSEKGADEKANHGLLSALFTYHVLEQLVADELIPLMGFGIVAKHHGNLKDFRDLLELNTKEINLLQDQFAHLELTVLEEILQESQIPVVLHSLTFEELLGGMTPARFRKKWRDMRSQRLQAINHYIWINLVFSLLVFADKGEAIFHSHARPFTELQSLIAERVNLPANLVDVYREKRGWQKAEGLMNEIRNQIYAEILDSVQTVELDHKIYSINVPTGTGKTLATLSAGLHLRERLKQETGVEARLIYTLPFTSVIDQNYSVFQEVLQANGVEVSERTLMKHHHLAPKKFSIKQGENEEEVDEATDIAEYMVEIWNSEIVVTTFYQLLHTIFSNRNRNLKKFHQLANSIILLDEVQSIPHSYWLLIRETFQELSKLLNCYFVFITATMPLIFDEAKGEIKELARSKEKYFKHFDRIDLDLSHLREPKTVAEFKQFLVEEIEKYPDQSFLIVVNTIGTSIEIYNYLRKEMQLQNLLYLSTNIIPRHRLERIRQLKEAGEPMIVVSTQMIEAGVDIDMDRVYRDFGPLDSINQTCGRCNRNFDLFFRGCVVLVNLVNEKHHDKRYGAYVYGEFLLNQTEEVMKALPAVVSEKEFYEMNLEYFARVNQGKSDKRSETLLERMQQLQYTLAFENDADVQNGKSSMVFQLIDQSEDTVNFFVELDETAQSIWADYQRLGQIKDPFQRKAEFEKIKADFLSYVVSIPYRIGKNQLESHQLEKIFNYISMDQVRGVYDLETGFIREQEALNCFF